MTDKGTPAPEPGDAIKDLVDAQFNFASRQYLGLLASVSDQTASIPRTFEKGALTLVKPDDWTSGFFPGALWLIYEHTRKSEFRVAAEKFTAALSANADLRNTHDIGFMLNCSFGQGWRITGNREYRDVLISGARALAARFNPRTGAIRSWDFGSWSFPVIIDNMMNLELLYWAHAETDEALFLNAANSHADTTLANHFRADGSSFHLVDYDPSSGAPVRRETVQGFSDESAWARGQGWALYGFSMAYRFTRDRAYLAQAERVAEYIVGHLRLPPDGIPFWDFDAPDIPVALRDSSAGAIVASALLELGSYTSPARAAVYSDFARRQLVALSSPAFRAQLGEAGGFLLKHGMGYLSRNIEVDVPLSYGDYYFLEALSRLQASRTVRNRSSPLVPD